MGTEKKLEVLSRLGRALNGEGITWAVGASLLLYLEGLVETFRDIDLLVAEGDAYRAGEILASLGRRLPPAPKGAYKTKYFEAFEVEGVDIDLMAGLTIVHQGKDHYFPFEGTSISQLVAVHQVSIPLHSVGAWRHYYELMGRKEKVEIIDSLKVYR